MVDTQDFWDRIAEKYAATPVGNPEAYARTLDRVRHWLPPDASVLEIGCGTGSTALTLSDAAGRILATDISAQMLRIARQKAQAQDVQNVRFECAPVAEAGADRTYDVVMGFSILHLVADLPGVLAALRARLDSGGLLITKTPCLGGKPWFRPLVAVMQWIGKAPPDVAHLRTRDLEAAIAAAGFEIVETGDYPRSLPNHFVVARAV